MGQARTKKVEIPEGHRLVQHAYRIRLDPSPRQERALVRYSMARRRAYNWAVEWFKAVRDIRQAEREAGAEKLSSWPSFVELNTGFNSWKRGLTENLPEWWQRRHADRAGVTPGGIDAASEVYLWAIYEATDALQDHRSTLNQPWVTRMVRTKEGRKPITRPRIDFPEFKSRRRDRDRFKVTNAKAIDDRHVRLPVPRGCNDRDTQALARIHTRKPLDRLRKAISGGAQVKNTTVQIMPEG